MPSPAAAAVAGAAAVAEAGSEEEEDRRLGAFLSTKSLKGEVELPVPVAGGG